MYLLDQLNIAVYCMVVTSLSAYILILVMIKGVSIKLPERGSGKVLVIFYLSENLQRYLLPAVLNFIFSLLRRFGEIIWYVDGCTFSKLSVFNRVNPFVSC